MAKKYNHNLSLTTVLRYINEKLGASVQELELSEQEMMNIVIQQTIPTFSSYFPFMPLVRVGEKDKISGTTNEYRIPNAYGLNITGIHKIYGANEYTLGLSGGGCGYLPFTDPIYSQLAADRASMTVAPILFDFMPPNRIRIRNNGLMNSHYGYLIQIQATQPSHLKGIDYGYRETFCELAYLDVLISLYPIRNRFRTINTGGYGVLEFFLDEVNSAQERRTALIEKLEQNYLFSAESKKIWVM